MERAARGGWQYRERTFAVPQGEPHLRLPHIGVSQCLICPRLSSGCCHGKSLAFTLCQLDGDYREQSKRPNERLLSDLRQKFLFLPKISISQPSQ